MTCMTTVLSSFAEESTLTAIRKESLSPFSTDAKYIMLAGGVLTLASLPRESEAIGKDAAKNKPLGTYAKYGDYMGQLVPNILYAGGMWLHSRFSYNSDSKRRALFMTKTTAYSAAMTTIIKYSVREQRPDHSARNSFPSGHTTTAFAFAAVVGIEHEWYYAAPAYALAGFVGYSRMNDNKHYLNDVVAGATIGMAYAYGISKVNKGESTSASFMVPTPDMKGMMLAFGKNF